MESEVNHIREHSFLALITDSIHTAEQLHAYFQLTCMLLSNTLLI
jgi:hypothetical protein